MSVGYLLLFDVVVVVLIGYVVWGVKWFNVFGMVVGVVFVGVLFNGFMMLNVFYYM